VTSLWFVAFVPWARHSRECAQGDQLFVEARVRASNWTDKQGEKQYDHSFIVDGFRFGAPARPSARSVRRSVTAKHHAWASAHTRDAHRFGHCGAAQRGGRRAPRLRAAAGAGPELAIHDGRDRAADEHLAWLTPIAVILVMVLGAMAMANRIAQVSSTYGSGEAQTIVENCGNTLILRCSGSEHGGTSQFASRLIGEREVMRVTTSRSRRATEVLPTITHSQHLSIESAVMGSRSSSCPISPDTSSWPRTRRGCAWFAARGGGARHGRARDSTGRRQDPPFPGMRLPVAAAGSGRESEHARDGFEP